MNLNDLDLAVQEIISDDEAFESLADEWASLLARSRSASVFMRWEWHYTWWQVYAGQRDQLHIVTWRERGRLVGILSLYLRSGLPSGDARLRFLGVGEIQIDEVGPEFSDPLADKAIAQLDSNYLGSFKHWTYVEFSWLR